MNPLNSLIVLVSFTIGTLLARLVLLPLRNVVLLFRSVSDHFVYVYYAAARLIRIQRGLE